VARGRSSTGARRPEPPPEKGTPPVGLDVGHHDGRVVADPPAGVDHAPHQVHVLAHPQVRVEPAHRVEGDPPDHQGCGGNVTDGPFGSDLSLVGPEVEGGVGQAETMYGPSLLTGGHRGRPNPRSHGGHARVGEVPGQVVEPAVGDRAVAVDERHQVGRHHPVGRLPRRAGSPIAGALYQPGTVTKAYVGDCHRVD
jgi:hypothetical protein